MTKAQLNYFIMERKEENLQGVSAEAMTSEWSRH